ncbi:MAG: TIGR04211 family SH3 domain-containing protein [Acidiferrobacterales bacterium]
MKRTLAISVLMLSISTPGIAEETAYVTDKVFIDLRSEAHYESPIAHKILSGTTLEVLEQLGDFTRVRDASGREGWIENHELMHEPPARVLQTQLQTELAKLRAELKDTQQKLEQAQAVLAEDDAEAKELTSAQAKLKRQLASLRAKLKETETKLAKTQDTLTQERARAEELAAELAETAQGPGQTPQLGEVADITPLVTASAKAREPVHFPGSGDEPYASEIPEPGIKAYLIRFLPSLNLLWLGISFAMLLVGFVTGAVWLRVRNQRKLGGMRIRI